MTMTADIARIFADARQVHTEALDRLAQGDVRDAAEKAWRAAKRATDALTGSYQRRAGEVYRYRIGLERLATPRKGPVSGGSLLLQAKLLHGDCFSLICEPMETIERRIRETLQYIQDAEVLAES